MIKHTLSTEAIVHSLHNWEYSDSYRSGLFTIDQFSTYPRVSVNFSDGSEVHVVGNDNDTYTVFVYDVDGTEEEYTFDQGDGYDIEDDVIESIEAVLN